MATWVNYQQLRERLDFQAVLQTYGIEAALKGNQAVALCPFHGDGKSKSFSASLDRGIFQCFGCGAKGNVLEFAVRMEGFDPSDAKQFREGALKVQERFGGATAKTSTARRDRLEGKGKRTKARPDQVTESAAEETPRVINAPLDFELKANPEHPYLKDRKLTPETILEFGLGYCNRGLMKGRVVIPLHDMEDAALVGYCGRLVDDGAIDENHPKYLFPAGREVDGVRHEFWKGELLYNAHRFDRPLQDLIIVEGFFGCIWLHQCGFPNVVALMGSSLSEKQAILVRRLTTEDARVFLLPDPDDAGDQLAAQAVVELARERLVRWLRLPSGNDPDTLSEESVKSLFRQGGIGL